MSEEETLQKLRKTRAVIKGQFTKAKRHTEGNPTFNELSIKLNTIKEYWEHYKQIQDTIDSLTDEKELENEIECRCNVEDEYLLLTAKLQDLIQKLKRASPLTTPTPDTSYGQTVCTSHGFTPGSINFTPYHPDETITNFIRRLEIFLHLKGQLIDDENKVYILLHALTPQLHQQLYDICAPENPLSKNYEELVHLLQDFVDPQPSKFALQHKFISRTQHEHESVNDFSVALKKMTMNCDFNCECGKSVAELFLKLQFIQGLNDMDIRTKLLQDREKRTYQDIVNIASAIELAKSESMNVHNTQISKPIGLNKIDKRNVSNNKASEAINDTNRKTSFSPQSSRSGIDILRGKCYRCGSSSHRANQCRFIGTECRKCKKVGHIASVCLQKKSQLIVHKNLRQHQTENGCDKNSENEYEINVLSDKCNDKFMVEITIEGKPVPMELDTGAALSTMSYSEFKKLNLPLKTFSTNIELRTYTGEPIKPRAVTFVKCSYKTQKFVGKLYLIDQNVDAIFGRDWLREVRLDWGEIKSLKTNQPSNLTDILNEFSNVFDGKIGEIPEYLGQFRLIDGASPIFVKPRQEPFSLKTKVEKELKRLEDCGIITKIEHSDWGTPIVPVVKPNGQVRICADYKVTVNKVIKDENYPIPRIEEIYSQMNGGKLFCTLDISNAYMHMKMNEESALMQTISTHKGLYKVNRLMFGVKVAPSLWQQFMEKTLQGIEGVQCFFDDIILQGKTSEELMTKLRIVLERLRSANLKLNRDKCKFFQTSIQYLGHIIDSQGLHKTKDKVASIVNSKKPENVNELRKFLGLANYYNKFIKNLATILHPLNILLQKDKSYIWTPKCEESFQRVKSEIASDNVLVHYNPDLPLVLATDASPVGLGAIISHRYSDGSERPISFASRSLTKCEQNYSQIDKEATGIYWGLKKFFPYCYGRKFTLITDHKPLVSIFNPTKTLPSISATRLFNYAHFLSGFDYKIEYRKTSDHANVDFLSRFPTEHMSTNLIDSCSMFQLSQLDSLQVDSKVISKTTALDKNLRQVLHALKKGESVEQFGFHDNELTLQDGCIFKGSRVIIPEDLHKTVLKELHVGHLGIEKMKALGRSYCTWKNIDRDIEQMVKTCKQCRLKQNQPSKEENHPWLTPRGPWERIHIDFAGPMQGQWYFIVVDAFTKWVEVIPTKNTSSDWCVRELRKMFAIFGLPLVLVSDNGSQFTSGTFQQFLCANGVTQKTTAPYHPSSNGQAERFVQTVKKSLTAMREEGGNIEIKLFRLLMQLRQSPNATGSSAYELMYGRKVRTHLSLMHPKIDQETTTSKETKRHFDVGDRVQARNYTNPKHKWSFGNIVEKESALIYKIRMDDGTIWRRHIDHLLKCEILPP